MINYIKGRVNSIEEGFVVLECAGIGYKISMPSSSLCKVSQNNEACVYTYLSVREDGISLFGFITRAERAMFEMLLGVSGIGPKGALGILSSLSVEELKMAIEAEDAKLIASARGVGSKTAQKIVLELKGKVEKEAAFSGSAQPEEKALADQAVSGPVSAAVDVLAALGFSRSAAVKAAMRIENAASMSTDEIVSEALKIIE